MFASRLQLKKTLSLPSLFLRDTRLQTRQLSEKHCFREAGLDLSAIPWRSRVLLYF